MLSQTRRLTSRGVFNVFFFLALLLAVFAGMTSLSRQTGAVVATSPEAVVAKFASAAHATPTPSAMATKCMTSRWSAEGNANDSNGLHPGILKNGAIFGPGSAGQAFNLDGIDDYVEIPINTLAMNKPGSFTWEACVYPLSLQNNPVVFSKEAAINSRAGLQINSTGSLCSYMNWSQCTVTSAVSVVAPNQWTKVTLIYNGSTQKLITYVDGAQKSISIGSVSPYNHSATQDAFNIGWSPKGGGNTHFYGFIDEVSFSTCVVPPTTTPCSCAPTPSPTPTPIP